MTSSAAVAFCFTRIVHGAMEPGFDDPLSTYVRQIEQVVVLLLGIKCCCRDVRI